MNPRCNVLPSSSSSSFTSISKFISDHSCLSMLEKNCRSMRDLHKLHAQLIKTGLSKDIIAVSRVLCFCATSPFGDINYAYQVFSQIEQPNLFSWNTIIRGFSQSSCPQNSIYLFINMLHSSSVEPEKLTYPSLFKAYSNIGRAQDGSQLHGRIIKLGIDFDPFIRNTMIHMYSNCGYLIEASRLFNEYSDVDIVAWNSMIIGFAKNGQVNESLRLFDKMPSRSDISWNSMISGCVRNGKLNEAFHLFHRMQNEGIKPTEFTKVSLLNACAQLGALKQGEWIHAYIQKKKIHVNSIVLTAIIDMYCKCGSIGKALQVFEKASTKGLSSWNSLIIGLAMNGDGKQAIQLFLDLQLLSGLRPNDVSFLGVLTACSHSGMVTEAQYYFSQMTETYQIKPTIKHYGCLVDVLCRAGLLDEAEEVINKLTENPDVIIWGSLLSACKQHGNIEMGKRAADKILELDPTETSGYVLLANALALSGRYAEAIDARALMKERDIRKEPGCSLVEVDGVVHEFVVAGKSHPREKEMYRVLDELGSVLKETSTQGGLVNLLI
ncbi:hypothetical protein MKW98_008342 [Papaver atlanticum]|uniref:Pentatricopeptide repeat-containing protein n=1 Tax=Papaver atlanticum TaxID=357466 RepID=A0AAD4SN40_9MAGN|nr:hypothetical protein MKW98_008342 [Papaver atlanticum]